MDRSKLPFVPAVLALARPAQLHCHRIAMMVVLRRDVGGLGDFGAFRTSSPYHNGVDVVAIPGTKIIAPFSGRVGQGAFTNGLPTTKLVAPDGFQYSFSYTRPIAKGHVTKGEVIGEVVRLRDAKAYRRSPMQNHVHVTMFLNGRKANPTFFLEWDAQDMCPPDEKHITRMSALRKAGWTLT